MIGDRGGGRGGGRAGGRGGEHRQAHHKVTGSKLRDHATGQSGSPVARRSALTWLLILGLLFCASKLGGSRKSANGGVIGEVAWYAARATELRAHVARVFGVVGWTIRDE